MSGACDIRRSAGDLHLMSKSSLGSAIGGGRRMYSHIQTQSVKSMGAGERISFSMSTRKSYIKLPFCCKGIRLRSI